MAELQLSNRQASDFELIGNGGFAPLEGFMDPRTGSPCAKTCGLSPARSGRSRSRWRPIRVLRGRQRRARRLRSARSSACSRSRRSSKGREREADEVYRTTDNEHPGVGPSASTATMPGRPDRRRGSARHEDAFRSATRRPSSEEGLRRPRLAARGRVPDAQPDPSRT